MSGVPIRNFARGVVLEGSPDVEQAAEVERADEFDIAVRGGLVTGARPEAWSGLDALWQAILKVITGREDQVGGDVFWAGIDNSGSYAVAITSRSQAAATFVPLTNILHSNMAAGTHLAAGTQITMLCVPYAVDEHYLLCNYVSQAIVLVNFGAREGTPPSAGPGLYRVGIRDTGGGGLIDLAEISDFDALGTGKHSESFPGGTKGKQLHFRGIFKYGPLICGFGQGADPATPGGAKNGDNRVMFSNAAKPLKWGRDDAASAGDRDYRDIDAVVIGTAGEIIRAGIEWRGRAWIGTDRELHWFSGYGVDSIVTDGTRSAFRQNVLGPHCLIEGPDTLLHGIGAQGHWVFDGNEFSLEGRRLVRYDGQSPGYWDLIWTDASRAAGYPGKTNQDLVWLMRDDTAQQVWIVIPFCDATLGYGPGADTVVVKYDVRTGGYTRQVYLGMTLTAGAYVPKDAIGEEQRLVAPINSAYQVGRYGHKASAVTQPALPLGTPALQVTRMPAGPEGIATVAWANLTLAWLASPLALELTLTVDGIVQESPTLTIGDVAPGAPALGDVWLETNGGAASSLWLWTDAGWYAMVGGNQEGQRATIPVPFTPVAGTRFTLLVEQVSAAGRYQLEALTFDAEPGRGSTLP